MDLQGNGKGTDFVPSHDECSIVLDISCAEVTNDLITPSILENNTIDLHVPCDPTTETNAILSAPIDENGHGIEDCVNAIPTILSASIAEISSSIDMSAQTEITARKNEPCDFIVESNLGHTKLVTNNEELATFFHANSLFSIKMDPPMFLSHARNKIAEITCLRPLKSVYAPNFKFNLIGDYGVDNDFLVHEICITCDSFPNFISLREREIPHMLNHFDMTSNTDIDSMPNCLPRDLFHKHVVVRNLDTLHFCVPM
jgi:hypothetical protein